MQHGKIRDAAVFGCPDERRGEIPVAAVMPQNGAVFSQEEMEAYCREHLAGYKVPRRLVIVDGLPRVHGWKLLRRMLRETYCGHGA